jgi:hypothetical protein
VFPGWIRDAPWARTHFSQEWPGYLRPPLVVDLGVDVQATTTSICGGCAEGWMSHPRSLALIQRLIRGETPVLDENEMGDLALWAMATAVAVEQAVPSALRLIPAGHASLLYQRQAPDDGTQVFLGRFGGSGDDEIWFRSRSLSASSDDALEDERGPKGYVLTFSLNHLLVIVVRLAEPGTTEFRAHDLAHLIRPIWPIAPTGLVPPVTQGSLSKPHRVRIGRQIFLTHRAVMEWRRPLSAPQSRSADDP